MHGNQKGLKQILSQTILKNRCASFACADWATIEMNSLQNTLLQSDCTSSFSICRSHTSPCTAHVDITNKIYSLSMPSLIIHWEGSLLSRGVSWIVVDADTNMKLGKNMVEYCYNIIMFLKQKKSFPSLFEKQEAQFIGNYLCSRRWQVSYSRTSQNPLK